MLPHSLQFQAGHGSHFWLNIRENIWDVLQRTIFQHQLVYMSEPCQGGTGTVDKPEAVIVTLDSQGGRIAGDCWGEEDGHEQQVRHAGHGHIITHTVYTDLNTFYWMDL